METEQNRVEKYYSEVIAEHFTDQAVIHALEEHVRDTVENSAASDGYINEIELLEGGEGVRVSLTVNGHFVDNGIGPYEYWGVRGCDRDYEPEMDDEGDTIVEFSDEVLRPLGLKVTSLVEGDFDVSDSDGDGTCTFTDDNTYNVLVADEDAFLAALRGFLVSEKGKVALERERAFIRRQAEIRLTA